MFVNRIPWIILLLVWMAGATWWHVCKIKLLCADSPSGVVTSVSVPPLVVADGSQFRYSATGNFTYARSGAVANQQRVGALLDSVTAYLKANPGKALVISGYYSPLEQNATKFLNLGLARSDGIKQELRRRGLLDSLCITTGVRKDDLTFSARGDSLYGGLAFTFSSAETSPPAPATVPAPTKPVILDERITEAELANKAKYTSVFEPIDLYFPLSEAYYIKTSETAKFFREATTYLTQNRTKKLVLTGYTDSSGPDLVNRQLSRDRANAVKVQLRKSGINSAQIEIVAKGEADPVADNSTLSGRKANRRVTVVVQ